MLNIINFCWVLLIALFVTGDPIFAREPNVVLILTDDQGYSDVGFNFENNAVVEIAQ